MSDLFPAGERPFKDRAFRERLNRMRLDVNDLLSDRQDQVAGYLDFGGGAGGDEIWVRGVATFQSVNRDTTAQEAHLDSLTVPGLLEPTDGMQITWKILFDGCDPADPLGVVFVQNTFPNGLYADDSDIPSTANVFVAIQPNVLPALYPTIQEVLFDYSYVNDAIVDLVDPSSIAVEDDPDSIEVPPTKRIKYKKRKVRLNGYCPVDEDYTYLAIGGGGDVFARIRGDDLGTPAFDTIPMVYPPTTGGAAIHGDPASWIVVYKEPGASPADDIFRAYHLPPTTAGLGLEYNTCFPTITDGGDPAGGSAGRLDIEDILVEPDVMGHTVSSTPEEAPLSIVAGRHMVINEGANPKEAILNHSLQGTPTGSFSVYVEPITGGAALSHPVMNADALGHVIIDTELTHEIDLKGDAWIDVSTSSGVAIDWAHNPAQTDGDEILSIDLVSIVDGVYATEGSITLGLMNPYVDSKGHVNVGETPTAAAVISAGNKIVIKDTGLGIGIHYVNAAAGSPTSIGDVVTGVTLAIVGSDLVLTVTKKPLNVTTDSYGNVTALALGTGSDTTSEVELGEC